MIPIYLCEDEEEQLVYFQNIIKRYIEKTQMDARIVSARKSPENTLVDAENSPEDSALFFVDIQLEESGMNGFELVRRLKRQDERFCFVFLTSRSDLAYRVFEEEMDVVDYIVKDPADFLKEELSEKWMQRLDHIFHKVGKKQAEKRHTIVFLDKSGNNRIPEDEIICIETDTIHRKIIIYAKDRVITSGLTLKEVETQLGEGFLSVNRGYVVAIRQIESVDKKNRLVFMKNGKKYDISFRKVKEVTEAYWKMREGV